MTSIILASQSPIRKKILSDLGFRFEVIKSNAKESFCQESTPQENAVLVAKEKAKEVFSRHLKTSETSVDSNKNFVIIGVDTLIIDPKKNLLEKPKDKEDARQMMSTRSGKKEILVSGIYMIQLKNNTTKIFSGYEETTLEWQDMSEKQREQILATGEWKGKCGGVAVEGFTGMHIKKISGNYYNIMGFPINKFLEGLSTFRVQYSDTL